MFACSINNSLNNKFVSIITIFTISFIVFSLLLAIEYKTRVNIRDSKFHEIIINSKAEKQKLFVKNETSIILKPYIESTKKYPQRDDYLAKAIAILNLDTNEIVFEKNSNNKLLIASLTKLITTKIIYDEYNLDQTVTLNDLSVSYDGSPLKLQSGQKFSIRDALKAILISSNNQLIYAIDERNVIVQKANDYIRALHLSDTKISNPAGYDDLNNYSTAKDLLVIAKIFYQTQDLLDISSMEKAEIKNLTTGENIVIHNTNDLKKFNLNQFIAGKTGTTPNSGQSLILLVNNNKNRYIVVIIGSENRYQDAIKILNNL